MPRCAAFILLVAAAVLYAAPQPPAVPAAAQPSAHFDARAATDAWLATVPASAKAKSNSYFEGGYWLLLWDFLYGAAVMVVLLETGLSARMRDLAERRSAQPWFQSVIYAIEFIIVSAVLSFPLTLYEGFFREHRYGLSNQNFGSWMRDQIVALCVAVVLGAPIIATLFAIVRRLPRTWHLWGTLVTILFLMFFILIAPIYIFPLFNTYQPLQDQTIKNRILSMARANGIPATDVYQVNASRQSNRVSANVSGLFGTERITLNDNLLNRCSPAAVMSVMGHEMGHYVLHHIVNAVIFFCIVAAVAFTILRWALERSLSRWGARWHVRSIGDVAVLPLAALILSIMSFLSNPIGNTFTRTQEYEADIYGLNAAREPDGEVEADLLLGEYRKLDPSPLEEFLFFDHPSGRTRIYAAMRWKAGNLCLFDATLPCANPPSAFTAAPTGPSLPSVRPLR